MNKILWKIDASKHSTDNLWSEIQITKKGDYYITNNSVVGFNFLYISFPKNVRFKIYNKLNLLLFDSTLKSEQLFLIVNEDSNSLILRKRDVYNTYNPVTFKIKIYND